MSQSVLAAPEIGDKMEDGAIYAGISPDTNKPMYAASADEGVMLDFNAAAERAVEASQKTGEAYRLPTERELNVLFNNHAAIGGFNNTDNFAMWYWSSETNFDLGQCSVVQNFATGKRGYTSLKEEISLRLVRN